MDKVDKVNTSLFILANLINFINLINFVNFCPFSINSPSTPKTYANVCSHISNGCVIYFSIECFYIYAFHIKNEHLSEGFYLSLMSVPIEIHK